jgi:hypothetical protein
VRRDFIDSLNAEEVAMLGQVFERLLVAASPRCRPTVTDCRSLSQWTRTDSATPSPAERCVD